MQYIDLPALRTIFVRICQELAALPLQISLHTYPALTEASSIKRTSRKQRLSNVIGYVAGGHSSSTKMPYHITELPRILVRTKALEIQEHKTEFCVAQAYLLLSVIWYGVSDI